MENLSKVDICKQYGTLEQLIEALDSCWDLHELGYCDEATQKEYEELAEMKVLEVYGWWRKSQDDPNFIDYPFTKKEDVPQTDDDHQITRINDQTIEYWWLQDHKENRLMDDADIEHVTELLKEGYVQGELCQYEYEPEVEIRGWWRIKYALSKDINEIV
jgi:hypothetical protein